MKLILLNLFLLVFIYKSTCYSESEQASNSIQGDSRSGGSSSNGNIISRSRSRSRVETEAEVEV